MVFIAESNGPTAGDISSDIRRGRGPLFERRIDFGEKREIADDDARIFDAVAL
jgi:hypothetical protein